MRWETTFGRRWRTVLRTTAFLAVQSFQLYLLVTHSGDASDAPEQSTTTTAIGRAQVVLEADGLTLIGDGSTVRHRFVEKPDVAIVQASLASALGSPAAGVTFQRCRDRTVKSIGWGYLKLYFDASGRFGGWHVGPGGDFASIWRTAEFISVGSTRAELQAAYGYIYVNRTSLGIEFFVPNDVFGGMSGLLTADEPTGTITELWSGLNCIRR